MADDDKKKGKRFGPRHNWAGKKRTPEEQKPVTPPENKAPKEEQGKLEGIADKPPARDPMPAPLPPGAPLPKIQFGAARMYLLGARALRHYSTFLTKLTEPVKREHYDREATVMSDDVDMILENMLPQFGVQGQIPFEPDIDPTRSVGTVLNPLLRKIRTHKADAEVGEVQLDVINRVAAYGRECAQRGVTLGRMLHDMDPGRIAVLGCTALRKDAGESTSANADA